MAPLPSPSAELARSITRAASRQTDLTIALLVDRRRVDDAYRAYAYFRWVDDLLDDASSADVVRRAFLESQRRLIAAAYRGDARAATPEERILLDLVAGDRRRETGLGLYLRHMMDVMAFDVERRGRLVSAADLAGYSRSLAIAVTEALYYFIGHDLRSPKGPARYQAVIGAHIAHMLRDLPEDFSLGYFNIPPEVLGNRPLDRVDFHDPVVTRWVRGRVALARRGLCEGRAALRDVESLRCRVAERAYTLRFEAVLSQIERAGFVLRPGLGEMGSHDAWLMLARAALGAAAIPVPAAPSSSTPPPAGPRPS